MKMTLQGLPKANNGLYIGVLSGTSMNSIDAILINFIDNITYKIIAAVGYKFKDSLFKQLITIINSRSITIENLGIIDHKLGIEFSKCVQKLLQLAKKYHVRSRDITAIGFHGQTIWHAPSGKYPFTMQIGDPNLVCALNNIITVADFRRKDLALGGQGAPLATAFHSAIFKSKIKNRAIINIGGISNITVIPKNNNKIIGFDLGPGNCLMDEIVQTKFKHMKMKYDEDGLLASQGQVIEKLLDACLKDPYFKQLPPKSTGREYFNQAWLAKKIKLAKLDKSYKSKDLLATLLWLTAIVISDQINNICINSNGIFRQKIEEVYLCGGGAKNKALLLLIQKKSTCFVGTTTDLGIDPELVEGALFAWLAKQAISGQAGNMPSSTGARKEAILGAIYLP
jgi:anhydro-N-acetylmuramic acid kinase